MAASLCASPDHARSLNLSSETFQATVPNYILPAVTHTLDHESIDGNAGPPPFVHAVATAPTPRKPNGITAKKGMEVVDRETEELSESNLLLTSCIVYGFSLNDKMWCTSKSSLLRIEEYAT